MFDFIKKKNQEKNQNSIVNVDDTAIIAPADGKMIEIESVSDPVFSKKVMGEGVAFRFEKDMAEVGAPANGTLATVFPTGYAFGIAMNNGVEILIHIGINTVEANGEGFTILKQPGTVVKAGEPIVRVNMKKLEEKFDMTTMLIITEPNGKEIVFKDTGVVAGGQEIAKSM